MKHLIFALIFALALVCGFAIDALAAAPAPLTPEEQEAALIVRVTDFAAGKAVNPGINWKALTTNATLAAKVDGILAGAVKPLKVPTNFFSLMPKATAAFLATLERDYPLFVAVYRGTKDKPKTGEPGAITFATESACVYENVSSGIVVNYKKTIQRECVPAVRKYLRSQGKSFVTKNGVNPQQAYMDELTDILNAPRFAGLEAFLAKIGLNEKVGLTYFPDDAEIAAIKERVFGGEAQFAPNAGRLLYALGVEEYNRFVKQYNGEE